MKKLRGFKSVYQKLFTVTLDRLEKHFQDGEKVTRDAFVEKKIFGKVVRRAGVKIVNTGKLTKKLIIGKDIELTTGAAEVLRANGSTIEE